MKHKVVTRLLLLANVLVCLVPIIWSLSLPDKPTGITFEQDIPQQDYLLQRAYISGAVNRPGVYELLPDMRVTELISLAQGFTVEVDHEFVAQQLNLAMRVTDELHVFIPAIQPAIQSSSVGSMNPQKVSLNNASLVELQTLPGVGESTALKIMENRPYAQVKDITNVPGIGEAKYLGLVDYVQL